MCGTFLVIVFFLSVIKSRLFVPHQPAVVKPIILVNCPALAWFWKWLGGCEQPQISHALENPVEVNQLWVPCTANTWYSRTCLSLEVTIFCRKIIAISAKVYPKQKVGNIAVTQLDGQTCMFVHILNSKHSMALKTICLNLPPVHGDKSDFPKACHLRQIWLCKASVCCMMVHVMPLRAFQLWVKYFINQIFPTRVRHYLYIKRQNNTGNQHFQYLTCSSTSNNDLDVAATEIRY